MIKKSGLISTSAVLSNISSVMLKTNPKFTLSLLRITTTEFLHGQIYCQGQVASKIRNEQSDLHIVMNHLSQKLKKTSIHHLSDMTWSGADVDGIACIDRIPHVLICKLTLFWYFSLKKRLNLCITMYKIGEFPKRHDKHVHEEIIH